jgi:hypothetical protein
MAPNVASSRYKRMTLEKLINAWKKNPDNPPSQVGKMYDAYMNNGKVPDDMANSFADEVVKTMVEFLSKRYENILEKKEKTLDDIEELIFNQPHIEVRESLWSMIDIWTITYKGVVPSLKEIASSDQSVHAKVVLKATNDGICILTNEPVGKQKTLSEIQTAWLKKHSLSQIKPIIADMKTWGEKKTVMHKQENIYKNVLRGLWAKIKTFRSSNAEMYKDLLQRLWEECSEAKGLCADGHVGRLVNVLVGYDEEFKSNVSPMEYFQNNISLIAASPSPLKFKIEQANKLMDDINMPLEQRNDWISSLE